MQEGSYKNSARKGTAHENKESFSTKIKVNTCINFVLGRLKNEEIRVLAVSRMSL